MIVGPLNQYEVIGLFNAAFLLEGFFPVKR